MIGSSNSKQYMIGGTLVHSRFLNVSQGKMHLLNIVGVIGHAIGVVIRAIGLISVTPLLGTCCGFKSTYRKAFDGLGCSLKIIYALVVSGTATPVSLQSNSHSVTDNPQVADKNADTHSKEPVMRWCSDTLTSQGSGFPEDNVVDYSHDTIKPSGDSSSYIIRKVIDGKPSSYQLYKTDSRNRIINSSTIDHYEFPLRDFFTHEITGKFSTYPKDKDTYVGAGGFNKIRMCRFIPKSKESIFYSMVFKFVDHNIRQHSKEAYSGLPERLDCLRKKLGNLDVRGVGLPYGYMDFTKITKHGEWVARRVYVDEKYDGDLEKLEEVLFRQKEKGTSLLLKVFSDCMAGLAALHKAGLWHRDIKPQNMLYNQSRSIIQGVLIDFDFLNESHNGTSVFCAPELQKYFGDSNKSNMYKRMTCEDNQRADLWSMGRSLLELLEVSLSGIMLNTKGCRLRDILNLLWKYDDSSSKRRTSCEQQLRQNGFDEYCGTDSESRINRRNACQYIISQMIQELKKIATEVESRNHSHGNAYMKMIEIAEMMLEWDPEKRGSAEKHAKVLDDTLATLS